MPVAAALFLAVLQAAPCLPAAERAYGEAVAVAQAEGAAPAAGPLGRAVAADPSCARATMARTAIEAWGAARAAAPLGGSPEALAAPRERLAVLSALPGGDAVAYASAAVTAAMAAAQDERPEMGLYLEQARALALRLSALGTPALWPLPIDELEGELWLEVDRYGEGCAAYRRALATATGSGRDRIAAILARPECSAAGWP